MDNGRNLSYVGTQDMKYAEVASGGKGMKMMVKITGGNIEIIEPPFLVFQNKSRYYRIRGVPDDVPGASYRTGRKGWMGNRVSLAWLDEPREISKKAFGWKIIIYLDNCSGHFQIPEKVALLDKLMLKFISFQEM